MIKCHCKYITSYKIKNPYAAVMNFILQMFMISV